MDCERSQEVDKTFIQFWDSAIILFLIPLMILFGLISNGICFLIICKTPHTGSGSTPILLNLMVACETVALIFALFEHPINTLIINLNTSHNTTSEINIYANFIQFSIPTSYILHRITVFLVIFMTFQQYIIVYKPKRRKNLLALHTISKILLIVYLAGLFFFSVSGYINAI